VDVDRARRQEWEQFVRPFDDRHAVAAEKLLEAEIEQLGQALRAIGIDVVDGQAAAVFVDEHEGGAHRTPSDAEPARESLREARLARAQVAGQRDHVARAETFRETRRDLLRLLRAMRSHLKARAPGLTPAD